MREASGLAGLERRGVFSGGARVIPGRRGQTDLTDVAKAKPLVLDEFGYVPFDVDEARLLNQAMPKSHGRRSAAFTTNAESGRRGTVFADD